MARPLSEKETHPSFGWAHANVVSTTGTTLFDSEIKHQHYVILQIGQAERSRDLNRDWIHQTGVNIVEVAMSMAQWGALVSSFGSSGVPVTIERLNGERIEPPKHEPRMAQSVAEVEGAVDHLMEDIAAATAAVTEAFDAKAGRKEMGVLLRNLHYAIKNSVPNAKYAADTLTEHVENVVTKARYDIEAAAQAAAARGLEPGGAALLLGPASQAE